MKLFYFQQREENSLKNRTRFQPLFHRHGSLAIRSKKDLPGIPIPFALCLSRTNGADFRASRSTKEKKLKKTNRDRGKGGDDLPPDSHESPPSFCARTFLRLVLSARLSQQVHPWCRALFPFSLSSSFSSSFLPFTRRHLRRYSSRVNRRSSLRRFNRSTEAIRVKMMRWISER